MSNKDTTRKLRILVVDDHALVREAVAEQIAREEDFVVVGQAGDAGKALELATKLQPDIVVMDIDMPGMICFDAARRIAVDESSPRIIFLSAFFHDHYIEQALKVKARGYVVKTDPPSVLLDAIREVARGGSYFSERVRSRLVVGEGKVELAEQGQTAVSLLTQREIEVLRYVARGLSKKEIAKTMHLSIKTVENHSARLMAKLNIHDRVELARFAIREGLAEA